MSKKKNSSIEEQFKRYKLIPIDQLEKAPWNYKEEDELNKKALLLNIKRNGQVLNSIVRKLPNGKYEIGDGNHRFDVMVELGLGGMICYDCGDISVAELQRLAVEINETRFPTNDVKLGKLFVGWDGVFDRNDILATVPFGERDYEHLRQISKFDFASYEIDRSEGKEEKETTEEWGDGEYRALRVIVDKELFAKWKEFAGGYETEKRSERKAEMIVFDYLVTKMFNDPKVLKEVQGLFK